MELKDFVSHFKLQNMPFTNRIGTEYLYSSDNILGIQNKLQLAVQDNSFAVLSGEPGTGKSTILRKFTSELNPDKFLVLYVSMSNATPRWLYSVPLEMLGIKAHTYVNDARRQFHKELDIQRETYHKKVIMVVDEAHLFTMSYKKFDLLEEIRFLLNGERYDSGSPLTLILSGQSEIWNILKTERCKAITQRIMYVCKTDNLTKEQVGPYIASHLRWAGSSEPLFSSEAVDLISELSSGIPRLINKICIHSLNYAALKNQSVVTPELAAQAANNEVIDIILKGACA